MTRLLFWRKPTGPSEEAQEALAHAHKLREKADTVYAERETLLQKNHFADRIRLIYEGRI